jgi:hypothetical protein
MIDMGTGAHPDFRSAGRTSRQKADRQYRKELFHDIVLLCYSRYSIPRMRKYCFTRFDVSFAEGVGSEGRRFSFAILAR